MLENMVRGSVEYFQQNNFLILQFNPKESADIKDARAFAVLLTIHNSYRGIVESTGTLHNVSLYLRQEKKSF